MNLKFLLKQELKMLSQNVFLPLAYRLGCLRPCDRKRVIFADAHHKSRPESMDRLFRVLSAPGSGFAVTEWYRDFGQMSIAAQFLASVSFMRLYAGAGTVVLCDNFLPAAACRARRETTVVQLWHGPGAFKKFGYDAADDIPSFYRGNVYRNTGLVTVSGPACVKPFSHAMRLKKGIVRPLGISRMDDCLSDAWREACRKEFAAAYPEAAGKKVLLWAPTFRGNAGAPRAAGLEEVRALAKELGEEWLVVISLHPHLRTTVADENCFGRIPSERILPAADVFMTDYSSLLYDACLQKRRMLIFAPDLEEFLAERGTYMDIREFPGEIVTEARKLADAVRRTLDGYDYERQKAFSEKYLSACDGRATERIVKVIKEKSEA